MSYMSPMLSTLADILAGRSPMLLSGIRFNPPATVLTPRDTYKAFDQALAGPKTRWCCSLNAQTWRDQVFLASSDVAGHSYQTGGGRVGYVYTRHGGIVDVGHMRDLADLTRYLASRAYYGSRDGITFEMEDDFGGKPQITFIPTGSDPSPTLAALLGARIAYESAIWHEIATWFSITPTQKSSSFSPEDNFSNLLGAFVGFQAILKVNTEYDQAVDDVLARTLINELEVMDKPITKGAINYVEGHWFDTFKDTYRRHLNAWPVVTPWLVTDVPVPGKNSELTGLRNQCGGRPPAISIYAPERFAEGNQLTLLSKYYELVIQVSDSNLQNFLTEQPTTANPIPATSLPDLVEKLRVSKVITQYPRGDQPF